MSELSRVIGSLEKMMVENLQNYLANCAEVGLSKLEEIRGKNEPVYRDIDSMKTGRGLAQSEKITLEVKSWNIDDSTGRMTFEVEPCQKG